MKTYIFFAVLILGFAGVITAMVRPDIVEAKYMEMRAPYDQHKAEQIKQTWEQAREAERTAWMLKLQLPNDCNTSALKELECKNLMEEHRQVFAKMWNNKVKSGWKPEGLIE